eukprot:CAMPEP_0183338940 /NCGR_PEP_ID=MMETSP0164_2-20130417/6056_1 /TAXON_ID=221442 /ORGANISM="Coccolithus pelagicus ssp braarudi, Strain PLY182g" /LENGTH=50 /DNA_ID=CAMNT_0025508867 /DNA_START=347 /DNA_END=499 /DNA_ORIENTATION=+
MSTRSAHDVPMDGRQPTCGSGPRGRYRASSCCCPHLAFGTSACSLHMCGV